MTEPALHRRKRAVRFHSRRFLRAIAGRLSTADAATASVAAAVKHLTAQRRHAWLVPAQCSGRAAATSRRSKRHMDMRQVYIARTGRSPLQPQRWPTSGLR